MEKDCSLQNLSEPPSNNEFIRDKTIFDKPNACLIITKLSSLIFQVRSVDF